MRGLAGPHGKVYSQKCPVYPGVVMLSVCLFSYCIYCKFAQQHSQVLLTYHRGITGRDSALNGSVLNGKDETGNDLNIKTNISIRLSQATNCNA